MLACRIVFRQQCCMLLLSVVVHMLSAARKLVAKFVCHCVENQSLDRSTSHYTDTVLHFSLVASTETRFLSSKPCCISQIFNCFNGSEGVGGCGAGMVFIKFEYIFKEIIALMLLIMLLQQTYKAARVLNDTESLVSVFGAHLRLHFEQFMVHII